MVTLLPEPKEDRDEHLPDTAREAVMAAIITSEPESDPSMVPLAIALRAHIDEAAALSHAERTMLREWLERLANGDARNGEAAR